MQLSALDFRHQLLGKPSDPFEWNILGRPLAYMIAEIFGYLLLTILIDNGTLLKAGGFIWTSVVKLRLADSFSGMILKHLRLLFRLVVRVFYTTLPSHQ